jgi:hypothetical protein
MARAVYMQHARKVGGRLPTEVPVRPLALAYRILP